MNRRKFFVGFCAAGVLGAIPVSRALATWKHLGSGLRSGKLHIPRFPWTVHNKSFRKMQQVNKLPKWYKPKGLSVSQKKELACDYILRLAGLCN